MAESGQKTAAEIVKELGTPKKKTAKPSKEFLKYLESRGTNLTSYMFAVLSQTCSAAQAFRIAYDEYFDEHHLKKHDLGYEEARILMLEFVRSPAVVNAMALQAETITGYRAMPLEVCLDEFKRLMEQAEAEGDIKTAAWCLDRIARLSGHHKQRIEITDNRKSLKQARAEFEAHLKSQNLKLIRFDPNTVMDAPVRAPRELIETTATEVKESQPSISTP